MEAKATYLAKPIIKVVQVRLFIKNPETTYIQHLKFTQIEKFTTLRNVSMFVEEESVHKKTQNQTHLGE